MIRTDFGGLLLLFRSLLFFNSGNNPRLGSNELFCGHTEFKESGNGLGEAEANETSKPNGRQEY